MFNYQLAVCSLKTFYLKTETDFRTCNALILISGYYWSQVFCVDIVCLLCMYFTLIYEMCSQTRERLQCIKMHNILET